MLRFHPARLNDSHFARLFLIGLAAVGFFVALSGVSPNELVYPYPESWVVYAV